MHHKSKMIAGIVATGIMAMTLAGCGGQVNTAGDDEYKIMYLLPTLADEAYSREAEGAKTQAALYDNVTLDVQAGQLRTSAQKLISKIENAVTQQYDAIIVDAAEEPALLVPALKEAMAAGVKVLTIVQEFPGLTPDVMLSFDESGSYVEAGQHMGELLPEGGEIGIIVCDESAAFSRLRVSSFEEGLPDNIVRVALADAHCDPAAARTVTENMLTANPELVGIFNNTDIATVGTIEALRAAGKDLVLIGGDGQTANLEFMANGDIQDAAPQYPSEVFGALGVRTAVQLISGEKVPSVIDIPTPPLITTDNAAEVLKYVQDLQSGRAKVALPEVR